MTINTYKNKITGETVAVATEPEDDIEFCLALRVAHLYGNSNTADWKLVSCRKSDVGCN